jgi:squalene-associated FAD-dependent desaturase
MGVQAFLEDQPRLYFMTPDRRVSLFKADPWPAPFHLGRTLLSAHYLTMTEKLRIVYGLAALLAESPVADPPLEPWLLAHKQTRRTIDRFWSIILTSALNENVSLVGLKYARKVFRDGFIRHRDGFTVQVPRVPLGRLYGEELRQWLTNHHVDVYEGTAVRTLNVSGSSVTGVTLREGSTLTADLVILAVPFERVRDLVPSGISIPEIEQAQPLTPSPITSVHLWYSQPITNLPHVVLIDCEGQWLFNRGAYGSGEYYVQVVVSAARELKSRGRDEIQRRIVAELAMLFPEAKPERLRRAKVVTEHHATFSAVPGVDNWRPSQTTAIQNLYLAGDWTQTGWPATMEGAVRSGYLVAEAVLARAGKPERLIQPELGG